MIPISGSWKRSCWTWRGKGPNVAAGSTVSEAAAGVRSLWAGSAFSPASARSATTTFVKSAEQSSPKGPGCATCAPRSRKRTHHHRHPQTPLILFFQQILLPGTEQSANVLLGPWRRWRVTGSTIRASTASPPRPDTALCLTPLNGGVGVRPARRKSVSALIKNVNTS